MASSTIFKNFTIPVEKKSLLLIGKDIISDKYKTEIEEIRNLIAQGNKAEADNKKKQLLAFTPSAVFTEKRQMPFLEMYSGFVHLDFDKLTLEQLQTAFAIISKISYTSLCFISPSGNGLKVFVEVSTELEHHDIAYLQVQKYYEDATGLKADPSCKDVTRLCFMSHDPNAYRTIQNEKFIVALPQFIQEQQSQTPTAIAPVVPIEKAEPEDLNITFLFNQQIQFTNQKASYTDGNRNNFIYLLASNCNRVGLSQSDTEILCTQHYDLSEREIKTAVNSAYSHHTQEHKKFEPKQKATDQEETQPEEQMPTLPDAVFDTIPEFLKHITQVATTKEERDILLLGSLVTLSVAFPKLIGKYGDNPVNTNLFIFISAKASAGKGILIHCRKLVEPIHLALRNQAKIMKQQFEVDMQEYNANKGKDANTEKPQKPPQKMLFIPANNSATGFLEILGDSDKRGLIFETEGDTLAKAFKSDYGDFSDGFRNAFQHEPISYYRRTDKEYVEIDRPCLSALLSGTPKQITTLIPNAENGLFSRFMFYVMNMKLIWKDVFASKTENGLDVHFEKLGNEFFSLYQTLQANPDVHFSLTPSQQLQFNQFFEKMQTLYVNIQEEEIISSVRRLGLIAYRIMMIFSALRIMEDGEITTSLYCNDTDFQNTLDMITILVKHSSYVYSQIAQETYKPKPKHKKEQFLENLPYHFNRQTYVATALSLGITDKSAQRYIKEFKDADIIQYDGHDQYTNPNAKNPQ
ncbi:MAG: DUF3987 domain-containing protein [Saprospiraceae bacterium]|jgi:hypothetical protein|nr:DUF3987 domain-containing protein [Saprospiraceae bacterium]